MSSYVSTNLIAYFDPSQSYPGSGATMSILSGTASAATLSGTYSLNSDRTLRITNTSTVSANNTSRITIPSLTFRTISFWMKIESTPVSSSTTNLFRYLLDARSVDADQGWILDQSSTTAGSAVGYELGSNWNGGTLYVNGVQYTLDTTNIARVFEQSGWKHVTVIASATNITRPISLFARYNGVEGLDVSVGPILVYSAAISAADNTTNYSVIVPAVGNYPSTYNITGNTFPHTALTSNNSNGYITRASSTINANTHAWKAFNNLDGDYTTSDYWHSSDSAGFLYDIANGDYAAASTSSTTVSGTTYKGEWLEVQLPTAIRLYGFILTPRRDQGQLIGFRAPRNFIIAGSNDGSNWTMVFSNTSVSWTNEYPRIFQNATPSTAYRFYRLIVRAVMNPPNGGTGTGNTVQITEWRLIADAVAYPQVMLTDFRSNGYVASASSVAPLYNHLAAWKAFDFNETVQNFWHSDSVYSSTNGTYIGNVNTVVDGSNFAGEWLQIQMPSAIQIDSFTIRPRVDNGTVDYQTPVNFVLVASNDGTSWTMLYSITNNSFTNLFAKTFYLNSISKLYRYFRLIIQTISQTVAAQNIVIQEFRLNRPTPVTAIAGGQGDTHSLAFGSFGSELPTNWVGLGKSIFNSTDGTAFCYDVVYNSSQKRWVAAGTTGGGETGTNTLATSTDGIFWTGLGKTVLSSQAVSVATSGDLWVAVGSGTNSIATSVNGTSWTGVSSANGGSIFSLGLGVAWNSNPSTPGTDARWVIGGSNVSTRKTLAYSTNGISWELTTNDPFSQTGADSRVWAVCYGYVGTTNRWVAGGLVNSNSNALAWSDDGKNWNAGSIDPFSFRSTSAIFSECLDIAWNNKDLFVAVGVGTNNSVATSSDGKVWTGEGKPANMTKIWRVRWTGTYWIAGGENTTGNHTMVYSTDGINWTGMTSTSFWGSTVNSITTRALGVASTFNQKSDQTLTFVGMSKTISDISFTPSVTTDAVPNYSSYTFSVPANNGVVTTDGSSITIIGTGSVDITVVQASNDLYNSATATATLKVLNPNAYPVVPVSSNYGYVAFASGSSKHLVGSTPTTFNIGTNSGFTAIVRVRFNSNSTTSATPIFDFGVDTTATNNNIYLQRVASSSNLEFGIYNSVGTTTFYPYTVTGGDIVVGQWTTIALRYRFASIISQADTATLEIYQDGVLVATQAPTGATGSLLPNFSNRTFASSYIGRNSAGVYSDIDVIGLLAYDRPLTNAEMDTCGNVIAGTMPMTTIPITPLYNTLSRQLTTTNNQAVTSWGRFRHNVNPGYNSYGYLSFDRTQLHYVDVGSSINFSNIQTSGFTALCLMRFTGTPNDNERVFDFGSGQANNNILLTRTGTNFYAYMFNAGSPFWIQGGTIVQNQWTFVVFRYNYGGTMQLYQDGRLVATGSNLTINNRTTSINYIGRSNWASNPYSNMELAGLVVYNRFLADSEIVQYRNNNLVGVSSDSLVYSLVLTQNALIYKSPSVLDPAYISLNRSSSQYIYPSPKLTFNIDTNGGFTAIVRVRFTGTRIAFERIFDFGNGSENNNLILLRNSSGNTFYFSARNAQTQWLVPASGGAGILVDNQWTTIIARYTKTGRVLQLFQDDTSTPIAISTTTADLTNRTLINNWIGRAYGSEYSNMDIAGMIMYDKSLTTSELNACKNILEGKNITATLPGTPVYALLPGQGTPIYKAPSGSNPAYVSFDRTYGQFLSAPPTTFNISTNGGFTAVCRVRFTDLASHRVFDFGNGQANNNLHLSLRDDGVFRCSLYENSTLNGLNSTANSGASNTWTTLACRYSSTNNLLELFVNNLTSANASLTTTSTLTNRTLTNNYIGRSNWVADPYPSMDLAGLIVYDRALSTEELTTCSDIINGTKSASSIPNTPVYVLLTSQLTTPLSSNVHTWGDFRQYTLTNQPSYQLNNEYLSFNRSNNQLMSGPTNTVFNLTSGGGFTAIARVRFTGVVTSLNTWETIFDFGNGAPSDNLLLARNGVTTQFAFYYAIGTSPYYFYGGTIVQNQWTTVVIRVTNASKTIEFFQDSTTFTSPTTSGAFPTGVSSFATRTTNNNYIGKDNWPQDAYANIDIAGLLVYDRVLTNSEITTVTNVILNTVSPNQLPATPVYTLLPHQLYLTSPTTNPSIASCGSFSQATVSAQPTYSVDFPKTGYKAISSSTYADEQPWEAFDYVDTDYTSGVGKEWTSVLAYSSTGSYSGSESTTVRTGSATFGTDSTSSTSGEWLQIQLPVQLLLMSFVLTPGRDGTSVTNAPKDFTIVGSNDASSWYSVYSTTNTTWTTEYPRVFSLPSPATNTYRYYRLIVQNLSSVSDANGTNPTQITEWKLFGSAVAFPPVELTANSGNYNGYTVSASSELFTGNNQAWKAFDNMDIDYDSSNVNFWSSSMAYNTSNGTYAAWPGEKTIVSSTQVSGEWLQIQLPDRIRMDGFILTPRRDTASLTNAPKDFIIAASNNGTTWTLVYTSTSTSWGSEIPKIFTLDSPLSATYSYYRLIVSSVQGSATDCAQITEWKLLTNTEYNTFAGGQGTTHTLACSSDGVRWMGLGQTTFSSYVHDITYGQNRWMAVGSGTNTLAYSTDGLNWTGLGTGSSVFGTLGTGIAYNNARWIATGDETNAITMSTDGGVSWSKPSQSLLNSAYGVAWNPRINPSSGSGLWVVVGTNYSISTPGSNSIIYATDNGTTLGSWTTVSPNPFSGVKNAYCVTTGILPDTNKTTRWVAGAGSTARSTSAIYPKTYFTSTASQGGYIASQSANVYENDASKWGAWKLFDGILTSTTMWHTLGNLYNTTTGNYAPASNAQTTIADNNITYSGEWVQIQLPTAIRLGAFILTPRDGTLFTRSPYSFVVVGSNNGSTWTTVFQVSAVSWPNADSQLFDIGSAYNAFSYYRLIVRMIIPGGVNTDGSVQLAEWRLLPNAEGYPLIKMTALTTSGYTASASSTDPGSSAYAAWSAFDLDPATYWHSHNSNVNNQYDPNTGAYTGITSTSLANNGGSITGEWLQIQLPSDIRLASFSITPRPSESGIIQPNARAPQDFVIVASSDGTSWTQIYSITNASYLDYNPKMFYLTSVPTQSYLYYRIIVQKITAGLLLVNPAVTRTSVQITDWRLFPLVDTLAYSTNGTTDWVGTGSSALSVVCYGVKYNGKLWVAVGDDPNNSIAYSSDGITWTGVGKPDGFNVGRKVTWNGMYWIASGEGTTRMVYSADGINWSSATDTDKMFTSRALAVGSSTVVKYNQTLTFTGFTKNVSDSNFTPVISTDAIPSYSSYTLSAPTNNGVVNIINNNQLQIIGAGTVTITATQAENEFFNSATATLTFVAPALSVANNSNNSYTYGTAVGTIYGGATEVFLNNLFTSSNSSGTRSYTITNTNPSGCATLNTSTLTFTQTGVVDITANIDAVSSGTTYYASDTRTFQVTLQKADQTLSVTGAVSGTLSVPYQTGLYTPPVTTTANYSLYTFSVQSGSDVASVVNNDTQIQFLKVGSVQVTATQATSDFYNSANTTFTLTITKANQTLTFNNISKTTKDTANFTPFVSTNSTLITNPTFTFASSNSSVAIAVNNNTQLRVVGITGTATITATQAGNDLVNSATATATITVTSYLLTVVGTASDSYNIYNWNGVSVDRYVDAAGNVGVNNNVYDFTKDIDGNVYFVGTFTGTVKPDGSAGSVSANGLIKWSASTSAWQALTDSSGNMIELGGILSGSICADKLGNIYIGGNSYVKKWNIATSTLTTKNIGSVVNKIILDKNNRIMIGTYINDAVNTINKFGNLSSSNSKWSDGVLAPNGKIYGIPHNATTVLEINPATRTTTTFGDFGSVIEKWQGGVLAPNGKIYGIPARSTTVLEIDPIAKTTTTFGSLSTQLNKWRGGVLAPNGKIYGIPFNATTVLEIDPVAKTATTFGSLSGFNGKWWGGVLAPNGKIYGIPHGNPSSVLEIDPVANTATTFGYFNPTTFTSRAWIGGVLAPNGKIYGIPSGAPAVLEIDPVTRTATTFGNLTTNLWKWQGGALSPNGKIYGIPFYATTVLEIDPITKTTTTFGSVPETLGSYSGGVLAPNGKIYGIPFSETTVLEINTLGNYNAVIKIWEPVQDTITTLTDSSGYYRMNGDINDMYLDTSDNLYVGVSHGFYDRVISNDSGQTLTINGLVKWNATANAFEALVDSTGNNGVVNDYGNSVVASASVETIRMYNNILYIGGDFIRTGGTGSVTANGLIQWNPSTNTWSSVSGGSYVSTMNVLNDTLFMGRFDQGLFSWNGTTLTTLSNIPATYIRSIDGDIYDKDLLTQTLTFNNFSATYGDADFTPTVTTNASPSYSSYTFSLVTPGNSVASIVNNQIHIIGAGETYIQVTQAANATYLSATATAKLTVQKVDPTLIISQNRSYTYGSQMTPFYAGGDIIALNELVSSNSSGTINFSTSDTNPSGCASISLSNGNNLVFTQAGSVTINITQNGDANYNAITTPVTFNLTLNKASPNISGVTQKSFTYGTSGSGYDGTAGVDLTAVGVSSDSSGTLSFTEYADDDNIASVSSNSLTFTKAGTITIQVNQLEGNFHNALSSTVTFDVVLSKINPTISGATQKSFTYGTSGSGYDGTTGVDLTAVGVSSDSSGTLSFTEYADDANVASVSTNTLTFTKAGTITIQVNQLEGNFHNALNSTVTFDVALSKVAPTISGATQKSFTYGTSGSGYNGTTTVDLGAIGITSDSNGTLSYSEYFDPAGVGTFSGNTLTFSQVGTVTVQLDQEAGDFHNALTTPITFNVVVNKGSQNVSFSESERTIENIDSFNNTITLTDYATSATSAINPIQYSLYNTSSAVAQKFGSSLVIYSYGTITLRASQNSSTNYNASNVAEQVITVKLSQDITLNNSVQILSNSQVGDTYPLTGFATSSTGYPIQYSLVNTPSSVATIQTVQTTRDFASRDFATRDVVTEQVLVINGPGAITLTATQAAGGGYSQTVTPTLADWRFMGMYTWNIAMDATGQYIYRSFFSAASNNFVQRSTDGGATWTNIITNGDFETLGVSGNGLVVTIRDQYSLDGGTTWNTFSYPDPSAGEFKEIKLNSTGSKWYTWTEIDSTNHVFHTSVDYGQTWNLVYTHSSFVNNICMSDNGLILIFCTRTGIYVSVNGGSWNFRAPLNVKELNSSSICTSADCDGSGSIIYLSVGNANGYIYRTEDRGKTWYPRSPVKQWDKVVCDSSGIMVCAANSSSQAPYGQLWTSTNFANNWTIRTVEQPGFGNLWNFSRMAISRNGAKRIFAATYGSGRSAMCANRSNEISCEFPQYVAYVENLTRTLPLDIGIRGMDEEVLIVDETDETTENLSESSSPDWIIPRALTMTPEILIINNVISGNTVSLLGLATSDTQNLNPITYEAVDTNIVSISGTTMTILEPGTFTLKAYQASFDYYSKSNEATKQVTIVFSKSIWFVDKPIVKNYGDAPFVPEVETLLPGSYTFSLPANNGVATTNGSTVTIIGGGTVTLTVSLPFTGTNYSAPQDTVSLIVNPINQTLTFNNITKTYLDAPFTVNATTNASPSYNAFTYSVPANNGVATVTGNTVTIIGAGTVTLTATQAANANYNTASKSVTLTVNKANQTLTVEEVLTVLGYPDFDASEYISTTATPSYESYTFSIPTLNNVATIIDNKIRVLGLGTVQFNVVQATNSNYNSASASGTIRVVMPNYLQRKYFNLYNPVGSKKLTLTQARKTANFYTPGTTINFSDGDRQVTDTIGVLLRARELDELIQAGSTQDGTNTFNVDNYVITRIGLWENNTESALSRTVNTESAILSLNTRITNDQSAVNSIITRIQLSTSDIQQLDVETSLIASRIASIIVSVDSVDTSTSELISAIQRYETSILTSVSRTDEIDSGIATLNSRVVYLEDIESEITKVSNTEYDIINASRELAYFETIQTENVNRNTTNESNLTLLNSQQSALESTIESLIVVQTTNESVVNTLDSRVSTVEATTNLIVSRVFNTEYSLSELNTSVSLVESNIESTLVQISTTESTISQLDTRVETIESSVDSILPRISTTTSTITHLDGRMSLLEPNVDSIIVRVATNESGIGTLTVNASVLDSNTQSLIDYNNSVDSLLVPLQSRVSTFVQGMSRLEDIEAIETDLSEIRVVITNMFEGQPQEYSSLQLILGGIITNLDEYTIEALESRLEYLETILEYYVTDRID